MKNDPSELVDVARALVAHSTELAELTRGLTLNHVLFSGTVRLGSDGTYSVDFPVSFASVAVQASATGGDITVAAATRSSTTPTEGEGVWTVGPDAFLCIPMTGNTLTLYGAAGDLVGLAVLSRPQPPSAA